MNNLMQSNDILMRNRESTDRCSNSIVMNISTSSGKGLVSTSRTYTNAKWERTRRPREKAFPVGKPHPSQNIYDDKLNINNNDNFLESGDIFYSNGLLNFRNYVLLIYLFCFVSALRNIHVLLAASIT